MKALVTGGAGFIGSHLVDELVKRKYKVTILDNLSTGSLKNLKSVKNKIKFIKCDLLKSENLSRYVNNVDYIFHLASLSKTIESIRMPEKYYEANVVATQNLIYAVRNLDIKKFIYSASASCYGNPKVVPSSEKSKIDLLSPYASTKWMAENIILGQSKIYKFSAISLRFFNVYGPRSTAQSIYSGVISIFLKQKFKKTPLTVVGDGKQSRSFVHVHDVVQSMIRAAKSNKKNEIYNVGSKKSVTINKVAKLFGGKIKHISERRGEPRHSSANIKKIRKHLNWFPKISINEGIKSLLKEKS